MKKKGEERALQEAKEELLKLPRHPHWIKACLHVIERVGAYAAILLKELDLIYSNNYSDNEHIIELKAPSKFYGNYTQRNFQKEIHKALEEITGTKIAYLIFTV